MEPMNLIRTIANPSRAMDDDGWHFLSTSFTFDTSTSVDNHRSYLMSTDNRLSTSKSNEPSTVSNRHSSLPLIRPEQFLSRTTSIENNLSAFKPVDISHTRSFTYKQPTIGEQSIVNDWFTHDHHHS
jgi:hypothetical protein